MCRRWRTKPSAISVARAMRRASPARTPSSGLKAFLLRLGRHYVGRATGTTPIVGSSRRSYARRRHSRSCFRNRCGPSMNRSIASRASRRNSSSSRPRGVSFRWFKPCKPCGASNSSSRSPSSPSWACHTLRQPATTGCLRRAHSLRLSSGGVATPGGITKAGNGRARRALHRGRVGLSPSRESVGAHAIPHRSPPERSLAVFASSFIVIAETGAGTCFTRWLGGIGCRAMWQCTHSIGSTAVNGSEPGQHLVERDAERVEVTASIDRAVHTAGLFGRHVGKRAGDGLWRLRRLPLARQAGSDPNAMSRI